MKKTLLILILLSSNHIINAQGWIGNSGNNSIVPYNSNLQLSPLNVGIGINSPSEQLHTNAGVRFQGLTQLDTPSRVVVQDNNGKLYWRSLSSFGQGNSWSLVGNENTNPIINFVGTRDAQRLAFRTNNIEKATILPNGNIGVGFQNPLSAVHINRNIPDNHLRISGAAPSIWLSSDTTAMNATIFTNPFARIGLATVVNNFIHGSMPRDLIIQNMSDSNSIIFSSHWGGMGTEHMRITSNGNVGIGTSAPQDLLHVEGRARITDLPMSNPNDNLVMADANTGELRSLGAGSSNTFLRGDGTWAAIPASGGNTTNNCGIINRVPRLIGPNTYDCGQIFDNGANVGIGSTAFAFTTSTWRSTGAATTGTFRLRVGGNIGGTALYATSDQTLKTNINSIKNSTDLIKKLEGKTYQWTDEFAKESGADKGTKYGFLAQEVEKIMPEAVIKDENGRYAVEYNAFIPVLVESQKQLIKENEDLKAKLSNYDEKFALLEKTITQLCESGCAGLEKKTEVDALYQSIPNPTDSEALINYYLSREYSNASISIYTQDGKALKTIQLEGIKGNGSIKINLSDLSNGTYIYTLVAGERVIDSKKLQIVK